MSSCSSSSFWCLHLNSMCSRTLSCSELQHFQIKLAGSTFFATKPQFQLLPQAEGKFMPPGFCHLFLWQSFSKRSMVSCWVTRVTHLVANFVSTVNLFTSAAGNKIEINYLMHWCERFLPAKCAIRSIEWNKQIWLGRHPPSHPCSH